MLIEPHDEALLVWAPAKVNLYLEVLGKRPDGYHEIATVMVAVTLYDTLDFTEDSPGAVTLRCNHPGLSPGPDNLVLRAAELLRRHTGCARGARVRLVKRIPLAAGLAGGSSDAAATLAGLNRLWGLGLGADELAGLAAELGSDVAFFLAAPAAWCTGRGERVTPLRPGKALYFVLCCPPFGLATADVYRAVTVPEAPTDGEEIRRALARGDAEAVGRLLHNRLEGPAERLRPELAEYRARLAELRPAGHLLSGSGSTLFALCRDHHEAARIAAALRDRPDGAGVYVVRSCV
jgi:4-diphosphocytidyl-2-C-methyl-D-erythritol kinase